MSYLVATGQLSFIVYDMNMIFCTVVYKTIKENKLKIAFYFILYYRVLINNY